MSEPMKIPEVKDDFYQTLRKKIRDFLESKMGASHKYAEYLLYAPDFLHLLCRLVLDPEVPALQKAKLGAVIAYFISPVDLIPEALVGPIGYFDDLVLSVYALNEMVNKVDPAIIRKHWAGHEDVIALIQVILKFASDMVGSGLFQRIKEWFKRA